MLVSAEDDLLDAALRNGYVGDYSEEDALRTIENGLDAGISHPATEPIWYEANAFFEMGEMVVARTGERELARGNIAGWRQADGVWEFSLQNHPRVWFEKGLLARIG